MNFRRITKSARASSTRSSSADSSKKKISCDVTNLSTESHQSLRVIGTKTSIIDVSRAPTPEPVIKKPLIVNLKTPNGAKSVKTKHTRTKEILQELQKQLKPNHEDPSQTAKKVSSPYVVYNKKKISDIHSLVLELDNNLSFGSDSGIASEIVKKPSDELDLKSLFGNLDIIDPTQLVLEAKNFIGSGTYAVVYKSQRHGMDIAVKVFSGPKDNISKEVQSGCLIIQL